MLYLYECSSIGRVRNHTIAILSNVVVIAPPREAHDRVERPVGDVMMSSTCGIAYRYSSCTQSDPKGGVAEAESPVGRNSSGWR